MNAKWIKYLHAHTHAYAQTYKLISEIGHKKQKED